MRKCFHPQSPETGQRESYVEVMKFPNKWGSALHLPSYLGNPMMELHLLPEQHTTSVSKSTHSNWTLESHGSFYTCQGLGPFPQHSVVTGLELGLGIGIFKSSPVILMCSQSWDPLYWPVGIHQLENSCLTLWLNFHTCPEGRGSATAGLHWH